MESVKEFNERISLIKSEDSLASNLKISVLTIGAELGSLLDLKCLHAEFEKRKEIDKEDFLYKNFQIKYNPDSRKKKKSKVITRKNEISNLLNNVNVRNRKENIVNNDVVNDDDDVVNNASDDVIEDVVNNVSDVVNRNNDVVKDVTSTEKNKGGRSNKKIRGFFFNAFVIEFPHKESKKISVKIFPNGKLGITGSCSITTAHDIPEIVEKFVKDFPNCIKEPEKFSLGNLKINMINSNFEFHGSIRQLQLKDIINEYRYNGKVGTWRIATFQPGKYPGIVAKFWMPETRMKYQKNFIDGKKIPKKAAGQVTVLIFRSGSVSITGAKNTIELFEAYKEINKIVSDNKKEVLISQALVLV